MNLRDQILIDIQRTFMNPREFAELHKWNDNGTGPDRSLPMIVEFFTMDGKPLSYAEGVYVWTATVHIEEAALGYTPKNGSKARLDGKLYTILGVANEFGMLKLVMQVTDS